jgi:membrane-associated phospholipid phosphatase
MLRRPGPPLLLALVGVIALAATGALAKLVPVAAQGDSATLHGFVGLNRLGLTSTLDQIAHLAGPGPYAVAAVALALVALARRRWRVALAVPVVFFLTGFTTEQLKPLVDSPRVHGWAGDHWIGISGASWPSGHSTAAMTMALCAVMVAPPRLRPTVAVVGGAFAIAVGYSILTLAWHLPSDVFGGYLVAGTYVMLAIGVLGLVERRWPMRSRPEGATRLADLLPAVVLALGAAGAAIGLALTHRAQIVDYAAAHTAFVVGATAIAALGTLLAGLLGAGLLGGGRPAAES